MSTELKVPVINREKPVGVVMTFAIYFGVAFFMCLVMCGAFICALSFAFWTFSWPIIRFALSVSVAAGLLFATINIERIKRK